MSATTLLAVGLPPVASVAHDDDAEFHALLFTKTEGFRHDSIPAGVAAVEGLAAEHGFAVDHTEDSSVFTEENLDRYDVVVWLNTTGSVLEPDQQEAFEGYIQAGGGYAGIHSASDTHYDWPWYGGLVGAYFQSHPPGTQTADVMVYDHVHPSTAHAAPLWTIEDEWYDFNQSPRGDVHVLAGLDEESYADQVDPGPQMGWDHPIAWCQVYDGGRSWYTGLGHRSEVYADPEFGQHILGGIQWAAGVADGDCGATQWKNFEKVTLAQDESNVGEPMGLAVLPDTRVLLTSRDGVVRMWSPETNTTPVVAEIPVYSHDEEGLQGIAIDPDFENNGWVYVFYSPVIDGVPSGPAPDQVVPGDEELFEQWEAHSNLSRFQFVDDGPASYLDLDSEEVIIEVPATRGICCHMGGDIGFDADGNLFLATGDDANPFQSDAYTPIDERPHRNPAFDAQRTSGNTADLRGKLLRITPMDDAADEPGEGSTYTVPDGNLFTAGDWDHLFPDGTYDPELARPEIYAMGFRNPFRFSVDPRDGAVYLGDYGPDATDPHPDRGPQNTVTWHLIEEPVNIGWPYCIGDNVAYIDYDFATGESGEPFDCEGGPVNGSPRNTGLEQLPPVTPAKIWYHYALTPEFPQLGTGSGSPMGGPAYVFDSELESDTKWPEYYDGIPLLYEWGRRWIKQLHLDGASQLIDITETVPDIELINPMDMEFGPDGSLYVLEYGSGFFGGAPDSALSRIDYIAGGLSPVARVSAEPTSGHAPLEVQFTGESSFHPDAPENEIVDYAWSFGDGATSDEINPTHTYTENGQYSAQLTVTDAEERTGVANVTITVGNTRPDVSFDVPPDGGFFDWGDDIPFRVDVTDAEDGTIGDGIDCADVDVSSSLGHDEHAHPMTQYDGCEGISATQTDSGHDPGMNIFWVLQASYTDRGGQSAPALTGSDGVVLQPKRKQAQHFTASEGIQIEPTTDIEGGSVNVAWIGHGDWVAYEPVNLYQIKELVFRVASAGTGGTIEVRQDAPDGELLGSADVPVTGGWQSWTDVSTEVTDPGATFTMYLVFTGSDPDQADGLFNLNFFDAVGQGVASETRPRVTLTSPEDGASFEPGSDVVLTADATDAGHEIAEVEFLDGQTVIATVDEEPYTHTWSDVPEGMYVLRARATNSAGQTSTSRAVQISVGEGSVREPWQTFTNTQAEFFQFGPDEFVIDANGCDVWLSCDEYGAIYQEDAAGERFSATVRIDGQENSDPWAKAGIMARNDITAPNSSTGYAMMSVTPENGVAFQFDSTGNGELDSNVNTGGVSAYPVWLRLEREGTTYTGSYSTDGEQWTTVGSGTPPDPAEAQDIGMFATSHSDSTGRVEFSGWTLDADPPEPDPCEDPQVEDGYRALWNGESIEGWNMAGPGSFVTVRDADDGRCALETVGGMGLLWHDEQFESYRLKLDFKVFDEHDNSGIFVGFPDPGSDPWVAVNEGYEVQIDTFGAPEGDPINQTGAIYNFQPATAWPTVVGEWNTMEIELDDPWIRVWINGELVNEFEDEPGSGRDLSSGHLGLQNHGGNDRVHFRDVQISELGDSDEVSYGAAVALVNEYFDEGRISESQRDRMLAHLSSAERLSERGQTRPTEQTLRRFLAVAEGVEDTDARAALVAMGEGLIAQLE
ncbi:ThuA domain-containing protein [Phytoactinopolyspora mesophila]|uniref:DUF1080 domain-containing protein n=1 Tax=Phytoactinopolyspora mesophila TaxID=2650750 RepID=A0A7K3M375_9ACTN|nr:ThuA domain-containing protein [Phytoactinopolyspora mesophila]NDL57660.1 DUF1080 domain-containing protein [Phytoactinopolyspora mesophila]